MDLVLGVVSFTGIVLLLVAVILVARSQLVASGNVLITINGDEDNKLQVQTGSKLLQTLADNKIFLSSACGGGGTCSQCTVPTHGRAGDAPPRSACRWAQRRNVWHASSHRLRVRSDSLRARRYSSGLPRASSARRRS